MYSPIFIGYFPKNIETSHLFPASALRHYYLHFVAEEAEALSGSVSRIPQLLMVENAELG